MYLILLYLYQNTYRCKSAFSWLYPIPKTFFVEKITPNKNGMKYIENQKEIIVTKLDKLVINAE